MIHMRRPDGRDWDGFVHVNPQGREKALAFFYNPLAEAITREIRVPLHYAGLVGKRRNVRWKDRLLSQSNSTAPTRR